MFAETCNDMTIQDMTPDAAAKSITDVVLMVALPDCDCAVACMGLYMCAFQVASTY